MSAYAVPEDAQNANPPVLFDPDNEVLTTNKLDAFKDDRGPMLNNYIRSAKVGGGQHGDVYLCYKMDMRYPVGHPQRRIPVAMKSVKRSNPRAEQMKNLRKQRLPASAHVPLTDNLNTTEAKIRKEIAIMKKLRHPHIVRLYEVIDDRLKEKIYMVMEYLGGGEVKWRDDQNQPVLTVPQTRRILRDAVLGLEYLHYQGIIHRDIKPANLLWTEDRRQVKIGDFGVSHFSYAQRLAAAGTSGASNDPQDPILLDDSSLTRRAGTPSFLAPEVIYEHTNNTPLSMSSLSASTSGQTTPYLPSQFIERPKITKSIDIWALGVTLYCLLFGTTPFVAEIGMSGTGSEYSLYNAICNDDWPALPTMGADKIETGGRHPDPACEGANVIHLLDHFLQKDYIIRITLDEVKTSIDGSQKHAWILEDLNDPQRWLQITSPTAPIDVSTNEASDAMSVVHFRWRWGGKLVKQVSSLFRTVRPPPRLAIDTDVRPRRSEEELRISSQPEVSIPRNKHSFASMPGSAATSPSKRDKGKAKALRGHKPSKIKSSKSLRSKSIERYPLDRRGHSASSSALQESTFCARRGSVPNTGDGDMDQKVSPTMSRPGTSEKRARFAHFLFNISGWRPNKYSALPASPTSYGEYAKQALTASVPQATPSSRRSEEALRAYRPPPMVDEDDGENPNLTAARRASSWGQGDNQLTEVVSMTSIEHELNDHEMNVGAGGVSHDRVVVPLPHEGPSMPRHLMPRPPHECTFDEDEMDEEFGQPIYSHTESVDDSESGSRWHHGSELDQQEFDDSDDDDDDDDDSDQEGGVTFSPRRRPQPMPEP